MRRPEQRLWDRFRREAQARKVYARRLENVVGEGWPDVLCCTPEGGAVFVELKQNDKSPVRIETPFLGRALGPSAEQENWHLEWAAAGGISLLVFGVGVQVYGIPGKEIRSAKSVSAIEKPFIRGWAEVFAEIRGAAR